MNGLKSRKMKIWIVGRVGRWKVERFKEWELKYEGWKSRKMKIWMVGRVGRWEKLSGYKEGMKLWRFERVERWKYEWLEG